MPAELDSIDLRILRLLQRDGGLGIAQISASVGLSHTPCWRRIKRLEENGVIRDRVAVLDPQKVGLAVSVFAQVTMASHKKSALASFENAVLSESRIMSCHSISGQSDYLIRVVVPDIADYECYLKDCILQLPNVDQVHSSFALREIKNLCALPI
jgi:Lrp/AsnC family transcriptional regulator